MEVDVTWMVISYIAFFVVLIAFEFVVELLTNKRN